MRVRADSTPSTIRWPPRPAVSKNNTPGGARSSNCRSKWGENQAVPVNDIMGASAPSGPRKDDLSSAGRDADRKPVRSGARFRQALRRDGSGDGAGPEAGSAIAAALAGWLRPEPPPRPSSPPPLAPAAPPSAPPKIDRILIGDVGGDVEARIRIGSGALAGAEIRLSSAPGSSAVAAEVLTRTDGSRHTLSVVMDELRLRLRSKGIALATPVARPRSAEDRAARRRNDGHGSRSGGGTGS